MDLIYIVSSFHDRNDRSQMTYKFLYVSSENKETTIIVDNLYPTS